ncbi:MAG: lysophospholipid acyltransferase family protein [Spirochaetota bacterium]
MKDLNSMQHPGKSLFVSKILYFVGKYLYWLRFNVKVEVEEEIDLQGPVLVLSKHSSNHDIVIGYPVLVNHIKRHPWCIIKDSLAKPFFFGFFLKIGGIPVDRKNPEKSKKQLLLTKKTLHDGNVMVIFPEQSRYPGKMGRGKVPGFRFVAGKPTEPLAVVCAGYEYGKGLLRRDVTIRFGRKKEYTKQMQPDVFLHECMLEIASLSNLTYTFPAPQASNSE